MKIGIDTFACDGGVSGVGVYVSQLLRRIPPSGASYELFGWEFERYTFKEIAENLEFIPRCSINGRTANSVWHLVKYPGFALGRAYDACFFPAAHRRLPYSSPCPSIGTVHTMAAYWGSRKTREHLGAVIRMVLPNALRRLDRIIAVSHWVKQELVEMIRVKESKIEVVPNGVDLSVYYPRPRHDESVVLIQPYSFRRPYILYASRIDHPAKNHIRLIKAFEIFRERTRYPHRLILAGKDGVGAHKVRKRAARSPFRHDIFFTGQFPSSSLPELTAGADIVVFPSMYEGFGMGVLEAMAAGVPVACARAASLPETAEHAALYFNPRDSEDMADRMVTLATNRDIYRECRDLGLERVKAFSWDYCAERTLEIIQETAEK
jgi:glycosyltransferase involved in cell wall biosynthesis